MAVALVLSSSMVVGPGAGLADLVVPLSEAGRDYRCACMSSRKCSSDDRFDVHFGARNTIRVVGCQSAAMTTSCTNFFTVLAARSVAFRKRRSARKSCWLKGRIDHDYLHRHAWQRQPGW